jgi:hypothetical protein
LGENALDLLCGRLLPFRVTIPDLNIRARPSFQPAASVHIVCSQPRARVNRTIHFDAFVFLLLLALLFLLSGQLSRFSAPRSMLESGKAIDRTAVKNAILVHPQAVGLFPDPVEIKVSANDQRVDSSFDVALNKVTRKLRGVQTRLKDHARPFNVKIVSRYRSAANLVTRIHSWLVDELGRPWKEIRINGRNIKKRLTTRHLAAAAE